VKATTAVAVSERNSPLSGDQEADQGKEAFRAGTEAPRMPSMASHVSL